MRKVLGLLSFVASYSWSVDLVYPNSSVVADDQDYFISDIHNTRIIYSEEHSQIAEYTAGFERVLHPMYEKLFGYQLDTPLAVGLISSHNQIANGFSTQFPSNRQINYMGGAQSVDYFASSSWLDTLLLHETAHNYQTNVKDNAVSKLAYQAFKNGNFYLPFFPATSPNIFESSFILEGNAVLNESWHGKGGRLYSGRYRAMTNTQALAGTLKPERLYNQTLDFPYREGHYIFGASYQYYLAEKYGLERVNTYFKNRSKNWYFPFTVNQPSFNTFGQTFDDEIQAWQQSVNKNAQGFIQIGGSIVARSKYYSEINTHDNMILFITNESGVNAPQLHQLNPQNMQVEALKSELSLGRIFKIDEKFYSISSKHTSPWEIHQGLFDEDGMILNNTKGKIVQGYLNDGKMVYFDVASSFSNPQLYVDKEFYASVNSSVLVKGNNLYYFVQAGRIRTLYKNKQPVYSYEGYYGMVSDVDEQGGIYFIANSKLGSSLYRYKEGSIKRMLKADNIVAAKLINSETVLVEAISQHDYYYAFANTNVIDETPYAVRLFWDDASYDNRKTKSDLNNIQVTDLKPEPYSIFNTLSYTSGNILMMENEDGDSVINTSIHFTDPLTYHDVYFSFQKDANQSKFLGAGYSNNQHKIIWGMQGLLVMDNGLEGMTSTRDAVFSLDMKYLLMREGYSFSQVELGYAQDYIKAEKSPVSFNIHYGYGRSYGHSYFAHEYSSLAWNNTFDRGVTISNLDAGYSTQLVGELYAGFAGRYSVANSKVDYTQRKGIEFTDSPIFLGLDKTGFYMPSLKYDVFSKEAAMAEVNLSQVFNFSAYYFKFPLSLRREALTLAYRRYQINGLGFFDDTHINQFSMKLGFETVVMNNYVVRFNFESIFNDDKTITNKKFSLLSLEIGL